jgi:hypothetical protein
MWVVTWVVFIMAGIAFVVAAAVLFSAPRASCSAPWFAASSRIGRITSELARSPLPRSRRDLGGSPGVLVALALQAGYRKRNAALALAELFMGEEEAAPRPRLVSNGRGFMKGAGDAQHSQT